MLVISAQSGKTEAFLDIIGERMDTSPVPTMYVGPSLQFLKEQFEPRIMELLDGVKTLSRKVMRGRNMKKTKKIVAGVPLRLAHGGSSTALKSDPFGLALTDEADEMMANVRGMGNPIDLIDSRGDSYADFVHCIVSTPSEGMAEVEIDPDSGLAFWSSDFDAEVKSTIWKLWRSGTQYHWAMPCPHCGEYFIPRLQNLHWDKPINEITGKEMHSTPEMAHDTAYVQCPQGCADRIHNHHKADMNRRGRYVAPGQSITPDGVVHGSPPDSKTISFWVSGLASPFVTWGIRAMRYVNAVRSGDSDNTRAVINGNFGELYAPGGGEVPLWKEVAALASPDYVLGQVPSDVQMLTLAADVQKSGIYYTIRGWGVRATSWLIQAAFLQGETSEDYVWASLENVLLSTYADMPISLAAIDSGFRPGKKDTVPVHRVYEFCLRHKKVAKPTKGASTKLIRPIAVSAIDVNHKGVVRPKALDLYRLDTDHWKQWVHERVRFDPEQPGAWHLPENVTDDYCMQIVSEARIRTASGAPKWVQRAKDNHYFDCEAMQGALGSLINAIHFRPTDEVRFYQAEQQRAQSTKTNDRAAGREGSWLGNEGSIW